VFKALLSDGEEVGKSCTYKYCRPWLGSSLAVAEGKSCSSLTISVTFYSYRLNEYVSQNEHNAENFKSMFLWGSMSTTWHRDTFFSELFFSLPLSLSFHHGSPYSNMSGMNDDRRSETWSHPSTRTRTASSDWNS
jgi:hypothetical protein